MIATASFDDTAKLWHVLSSDNFCTLQCGDRGCISVAFSPDGALAITASAAFLAIVWSVHTGERSRTLRGHDGAVVSAAFSADGSRIITASHDGYAVLCDASTGAHLRSFVADPNARPHQAVLSTTGHYC